MRQPLSVAGDEVQNEREKATVDGHSYWLCGNFDRDSGGDAWKQIFNRKCREGRSGTD